MAAPELAANGREHGGPTGALILGGAHGSLAVARSLGRRGIPVAFLASGHALATFSRYVRRRLSWPGPQSRDAAETLAALAKDENLFGWVVFAGGDAEVRFLAQHHGPLSSIFRLTTPPWDTLQWAFDKRLMHKHAASLGIDVPWSYTPQDAADVARLACRFPVILKPAVRLEDNAFTLAKAWRADDRVTLMARYTQAARLVGAGAVIIQELIPGDGRTQYSYAAVFDRGLPVAALVARRRRQYPLDFGYTSTFVETAECAPVEDAAQRFLASLNYSGIAEAEFKFDARDGRYKLLDINTRTFTWSALGARAGVDFAHLLWRQAIGEKITPRRAHGPAAWMHFSRDLMAAAQDMRAGRLAPRDYLESFGKPLVFAAFAADDPLPGIVELPLAIWRVLTRRLPVMARSLYSEARRF